MNKVPEWAAAPWGSGGVNVGEPCPLGEILSTEDSTWGLQDPQPMEVGYCLEEESWSSRSALESKVLLHRTLEQLLREYQKFQAIWRNIHVRERRIRVLQYWSSFHALHKDTYSSSFHPKQVHCDRSIPSSANRWVTNLGRPLPPRSLTNARVLNFSGLSFHLSFDYTVIE